MSKRILSLAVIAVGIALAAPVQAESTLNRIKQSGVIKMGYRENSPPFSFVDQNKRPVGYTVELCQIIADELAPQLGLNKLEVKWIPVSAQSRFQALKNSEIDLECGNSTQTLSRRADFDFSLMTFVDGASLLYRGGEAPKSLDELKGQRVAVVSGTTTEQTLEELIKLTKLHVVLLKVKDHDAAMGALKDKSATAYAADRTVLITAVMVRGGEGKAYELGDAQLSYEPYGIVMRRDDEMRLAVDRTLARLYRTGSISPVLKRWFGALGAPSEGLKAMVLLNGLPE